MQPITTRNFGILIAYLLPGFIALLGVSFQSVTVRTWLVGANASTITVGGLLYSTLAAVLAGLLCSTVRWLLLDTLHAKTGLRRPKWDFRQLQSKLGAYTLLEENHYRFYQFYGNSLVAWLIGYGCWRQATATGLLNWADGGLVAGAALLYLGSRDTLRKYYERVHVLL